MLDVKFGKKPWGRLFAFEHFKRSINWRLKTKIFRPNKWQLSRNIVRKREIWEMKLFARPKCFSEAVALLTTLNCLLGLRVFEYPRGHTRPILSLIYILFIYGVFCYGSCHVNEIYYTYISLMKLEYVLYNLLSYVLSISLIFKMLLGFWYTKVSEWNNTHIYTRTRNSFIKGHYTVYS